MHWDELGEHLRTWGTQWEQHAKQLETWWDTLGTKVNQHPQSWHLHLLEWGLLVAILTPQNVRNRHLWVPVEPFHWLHEISMSKTCHHHFSLYPILLRGRIPISHLKNLLCKTRDKVLGEFFNFQTARIFSIC
jgi:hypothetical protein